MSHHLLSSSASVLASARTLPYVCLSDHRLDTKLDNIQTNVSIIKSKLTWLQMHGTDVVIIGILISIEIALFFSTDSKIRAQNKEIDLVKQSVTEIKLRNEYNAKDIDKLESRNKNSVEYNKEAENN